MRENVKDIKVFKKMMICDGGCYHHIPSNEDFQIEVKDNGNRFIVWFYTSGAKLEMTGTLNALVEEINRFLNH